MSEWTPYKINIPKESGPAPGDGAPLHTVYHVVHLATARRILEDGCLSGGLIYDESRLKKSRICVTWLSANTWSPGSIYGNVQFAFPWTQQIRSRCYWVEAMTAYRPPAYRILLTDRDLSESKYVRQYYPASDKGPLRERGGAWYWNYRYTSEVMVEGNVPLDECTGIKFIDHHESICRLNGASCTDFKATAERIGGKVIAFLLGYGLHTVDHILTQRSRPHRTKTLNHATNVGIDGVLRTLGRKKDRFGGPIKSEPSRRPLVRGALALYGCGKTAAAQELIALLNSRGTFEKALSEIVNEHFRLKDWTISD